MSFHHILVPTDFGDAAARATEIAIELARKFEARVTLVHAAWMPPTYYGLYAEGLAWPINELEGAAKKELEVSVAKVKAVWPDVHARFVIGEPWHEILAVAKEDDADLIVMGTHGRRGVKRVFLGSVAERVVRASPIPVMTVGVSDH